MYRQPGRLVQNSDEGIFRQNTEADRLGFYLGGRVRRQGECQRLPCRQRHIGVDGCAVGKKAAALMFDCADQPSKAPARAGNRRRRQPCAPGGTWQARYSICASRFDIWHGHGQGKAHRTAVYG